MLAFLPPPTRLLQTTSSRLRSYKPLTIRFSTIFFALLVFLSTLPAIWPFFNNTGYWVSHDGLFHLYRLLSLEEAWQQGYFYPRTFPDFAFGYGFAVLNFYGPLTYYIALIGRLIGFSSIDAMKATFALSYPLSALAMWWLTRDIWQQKQGNNHEWGGLVAAIVYTYVPYHLADVQVRGALAESWAFVWWPLLFWAVWQTRWWPLTFTLAALVLTHNLSVVLVAFPLILWTLLRLYSVQSKSAKIFTQQSLSAFSLFSYFVAVCIASLLITAFYWLPVLLESQYISIAQDVGGFGFERHLAPLQSWLTSESGYHYFPNQGVQAEHPLSWPQAALIGVALLVGLGHVFTKIQNRAPLSSLQTYRSPQIRMLFAFWLIIFAGVMLFLTPLSLPLWQTFVFPFGLIQYPWRWLGIGSLASAMLASYAFISLVSTKSYFARINAILFLALLCWLAFTSLQHLPWHSQEVDVARHPVQMWQEDAANGQVGATWTAEFLPLTVKEQRWALARAPEQLDTLQVGKRSTLRVRQAGGDGFTFWADVETVESNLLVFPRFAYPSMQATITDLEDPTSKSIDVSVIPTGIMGLASIEVPKGSYHVQLATYPLANQRFLVWGLTLLSLALVIYGMTRWSRWGLLCLPLIVFLFLFTRHPDFTTSLNPPSLFGEQIQLVGLRHSSIPPKAGALFPLRLVWFNLEQTDQIYSTFVHLTQPGGSLPLASHDSQPNMGTIPTSRWLAGQLVEDLHLLSLPETLAPGEYELWAGIYAFQEGGVIPIPGDSGERRFLGVIEIR